jgi:spore coat protein U-like protein
MTFRKMTRHTAIALAVAGALAGTSVAVQAAPTGTLAVTAQVADICDIVATGDVAFGTITPAVDNDATGTVSWNCTVGTAGTITMDGGGSGNVAARTMAGPVPLPYQLYTDAGRTNPWDDVTGISVLGTGYTPAGTTATVYGRVASADASAATAGVYADSVTVTITF